MTLHKGYRNLVYEVLISGQEQSCRNGTQLIIPHYSFTIKDMKNDHTLKLRKMYYKGVEGEFKTIISGVVTNVSDFEANGCNYWKLWGGERGELNIDYANKMQPQLNDIIHNIKVDPASRRHVLNLWDHDNVQDGVLSLPCCWHGLTFSVIGNVLHMKWVQRSVDTMVGLPSDIYLAYLFMKHVSDSCDLTIGSCMFSLSNVHIYGEHIEKAKELMNRTEDDFYKPLKFELKE